MLLDEDPGRQRLYGIVGENRHRPLRDDRPIVETVGHKVNRGAGYTHAVLERLALRIESRERRQQ